MCSQEPHDPRTLNSPISLTGEVRAHLLPSKACRPRAPGPLSSSHPQPPPLPRKTLTRTQSLPTRGVPGALAAQPRRPLLASHSVDESGAGAGPAGPAPELTSGDAAAAAAAALGLPLRGPHGPEALHAALAARELQGLRAVYARLRALLTGGRPGPCGAGHDFRLLERAPCAESGDALYYRVVRVGDDAWHLLAAKVSRRLRAPISTSGCAAWLNRLLFNKRDGNLGAMFRFFLKFCLVCVSLRQGLAMYFGLAL